VKNDKELYILYGLIVGRNIKVGITSFDRFKMRMKEIEKSFGKINVNKSFYYKSNSYKDIKNSEKALHLAMWRHNVNIKRSGSGETEFFKANKKKEIINIIDSFSTVNKLGKINYFNNKNSLPYISSFLVVILSLVILNLIRG